MVKVEGFAVVQLLDGFEDWVLIGTIFKGIEEANRFIDFSEESVKRNQLTPRKYQIVKVSNK